MILLHSEILKEMEAGNIHISPFNIEHLGPNSYDCTLQPTLLVYTDYELDMGKANPTRSITIPESGYVLQPGELYLGATNECATSKKFVPCLEGRSSIARLGISVHHAAGYGDRAFAYNENGECTQATWTLEITVVKPVVVYPNRRVCQVYFTTTLGESTEACNYKGKYSHQKLPQASKIHNDLHVRSAVHT